MKEGEPACKGLGGYWVLDIPANDLCVRPRSGLQTQDEGEEASWLPTPTKERRKNKGVESGTKSRREGGAEQQQMTPLQHRAAARRYVGGMMRNFASVLQRWDNAMLYWAWREVPT